MLGAVSSARSSPLIVMAAVRKLFHLEGIIQPIHFRNLGLMLLALDIVLLYFTLSEYLTASYPGETQDVAWLTLLGSGQFAAMFWWMIIGGFIVPAVFRAVTKAKSVPAFVIAAILVNVGMWIERYLIVVPTMATPQTPSVIAPYWPSWGGGALLAGAVAGVAAPPPGATPGGGGGLRRLPRVALLVALALVAMLPLPPAAAEPVTIPFGRPVTAVVDGIVGPGEYAGSFRS